VVGLSVVVGAGLFGKVVRRFGRSVSTWRRGEVGRCVVSGALSIRICCSLLLLGAAGASTSSSLGRNWEGLDWDGLDSGLLGRLGLLFERMESRGVLSTICWREAGAGRLFSRPIGSLGVSRFWDGPRGIAFWLRCTFLVKLELGLGLNLSSEGPMGPVSAPDLLMSPRSASP
jgi:hypothetical protein